MFKNRTRLKLKLLVKITFQDGEAKITKLAPILNQLNIEDAPHLDDLLTSYLENEIILEKLENTNFSFNICLTFWKTEAPYTYYQIFPLNLEDFFKKFSSEFPQISPYRTKENNLQILDKNFFFVLLFLQSYSFIGDFSFFFDLNRYLSVSKTLTGYLYSYAAREQMLGRKINFRHKVKKKKFEDY